MSTPNTKILSSTSKKRTKNSANTKKVSVAGFAFVSEQNGIQEYKLKKNELTILYKHIPDTEVITTNITYRGGARDETTGETGIAHMLEHMLFKPTKRDIAKKTDGGAMRFERETGCILNANTWRDRTTYFFNYPAEHFTRALEIEAERMNDLVLTDKEFQPERGNVLSEFDMYFGDPEYALSASMVGCAFHSHPYGHETIGFREDIERYTVTALERFYRRFYRPDNATLMVIGDITCEAALRAIKRSFGHIKNPTEQIPRHTVVEPIQEGVRRTEIKRNSATNLLAIGFKHEGFPSQEWFTTAILLEVLAGRRDSILHKLLVDTGEASAIEYLIEPTSEQGLGIIYITLAQGSSHDKVERRALEAIRAIDRASIVTDVKKSKQSMLTGELFARDSSLQIAMELTEHVAAGDWRTYTHVEQRIRAVTPARVAMLASTHFAAHNLTIGRFIGTN